MNRKIEKTNTVTNTWKKTKAKMPENKEQRTTVKFSNQLQRHPVSSIVTTSMSWRGTVVNTGYSCYLTAARRHRGRFFSSSSSGPGVICDRYQ